MMQDGGSRIPILTSHKVLLGVAKTFIIWLLCFGVGFVHCLLSLLVYISGNTLRNPYLTLLVISNSHGVTTLINIVWAVYHLFQKVVPIFGSILPTFGKLYAMYPIVFAVCWYVIANFSEIFLASILGYFFFIPSKNLLISQNSSYRQSFHHL